MSRLVLVTQVIDPNDPVLGVSLDLARALALRSDALAVIANEVRGVPPDLNAEVFSLGKEKGLGRLARAWNYQLVLSQVLRRPRADALLAHMCPIYLVLAAPLTLACGVKRLLWFTHMRNSMTLLMAERFADLVLTTLPGSYPRNTPKLHPIGHAIDTEAFPYTPPPPPSESLRLLALGRTSPVKQYPIAIEAIARARAHGLDARLAIVGASLTAEENRHRQDLHAMVETLRLRDAVTFPDAVPRSEVLKMLQRCDALVSSSAPGAADKSVFEAMAVGRPVLVSNPVFEGLLKGLPLSLQFQNGDPRNLADLIAALAKSPLNVRVDIGRELRDRVVMGHSLQHWADNVMRLAVVGETGRSMQN